jgi:hypothetical protein
VKLINDGYAVEIDYNGKLETVPCDDECRLILQFMPELYADMMQLNKENEN